MKTQIVFSRMISFNKSYYKNIWGTIHRHEYCEGLADQLIQKYGKVRILDIGTGCGFLVKTLREKGCDAWGLDISDYAIANSCDPEHVRKGDIRDIPFASDRFDVIHSQGVWGYFPEEDIHKAWAECKRVGKIQEHNIDYDPQPPEHQYLFLKSPEWWKNKFYPKILIACTTFDGKKYCFDEWYEAYKKLEYPNKELLMVDNSDGVDYVNFLRERGINAIHLDIEGTNNWKITTTNEYIRKYFIAGDYSRWFNLESDVLVPPETLNLLLKHDADWVGCCYRDREGAHSVSEWGCSLFSRRIMEETSFVGATPEDTVDGYWWREQVEPRAKYTIINLYDFLPIKHL